MAHWGGESPTHEASLSALLITSEHTRLAGPHVVLGNFLISAFRVRNNASTSDFYVAFGILNLGLHSCMANTLPTKQYKSPNSLVKRECLGLGR